MTAVDIALLCQDVLEDEGLDTDDIRTTYELAHAEMTIQDDKGNSYLLTVKAVAP